MMWFSISAQRLATVALASLWMTVSQLAYAERDPIWLTHGPMLGHVTDTTVRVWGRMSDAGEFVVHYGEDTGAVEAKLDETSEPATTSVEHDNTGTTDLVGLKPDTRYHYQIWVNGRPHGLPGRFRTLPSAAESRNAEHNPEGLFNFRFEIGSCANQNPLNGIGHRTPTYESLNQDWTDKVNFHIMNGDWLYEELREHPPEAWRLALGLTRYPLVVQIMPTIVGVWENYKLYLSRGVEMAKWHRNVPSYFTFDDHELVNDIWGSSEAGKRHRRTVFRDIGTQAWFDYLGWANPVEYDQPVHFGKAKLTAGSDLLVDPETDFTKLPLKMMLNLHVHWGTPEAGTNDMQYDNDDGNKNSYVYDIVEVVDAHTLRLHMPAKIDDTASYSIGRRSYGKFRVSNCEFYLIDTRGDRDMHDVTDRAKAGVSMLGIPQREWLLDSMRTSDADFFFVVSTVPFMIPHSGAGGFESDAENKEEAWTGFFDERELLIREWEKLNKKVFVVTGDLHNSFAIRVTEEPHVGPPQPLLREGGTRHETGRASLGERCQRLSGGARDGQAQPAWLASTLASGPTVLFSKVVTGNRANPLFPFFFPPTHPLSFRYYTSFVFLVDCSGRYSLLSASRGGRRPGSARGSAPIAYSACWKSGENVLAVARGGIPLVLRVCICSVLYPVCKLGTGSR